MSLKFRFFKREKILGIYSGTPTCSFSHSECTVYMSKLKNQIQIRELSNKSNHFPVQSIWLLISLFEVAALLFTRCCCISRALSQCKEQIIPWSLEADKI